MEYWVVDFFFLRFLSQQAMNNWQRHYEQTNIDQETKEAQHKKKIEIKILICD